MLVLVNDIIVELESPEAHANLNWKRVFDRDPKSMQTSEILDQIGLKIASRLNEAATASIEMDFIHDIAAIIVAHTGANVAIFPEQHGLGKTRITCVAEAVLKSLQEQCARGRPLNVERFWQKAA